MSKPGKTEIPRPLPVVTERMKPFFDAARNGVLLIPRCRDCGMHRFPAVEFCSHCLRPSFEWVESAGNGIVFSYVVMHQVYHPWFASSAPYPVVDVRLDEGARMISTIVGSARDEIRIGCKVRVDFERCNETVTMPFFRRVAA